jgi:TPR repeat protein
MRQQQIVAWTLCIAIAFFFVGGCVSDPIQNGQKYYAKGYCGVATYQWLQEAKNGNAAAQNNMGLIWRQGCPDASIPMDDAQAYNWFVLAAQNGEPVAMVNLGDMHRDGLGTKQDVEKAKVWYKLAARRGNPAAQSRLAAIGEEVPPVDFPTMPVANKVRGGSGLSDWLQVFAAALLIGSSNEYQSISSGNRYPTQENIQFQTNCYSTVNSIYEGQASVRTTCR